MCFTGERTERLENVVVNKHVNTHASSDMANYRKISNTIRTLVHYNTHPKLSQ